LNNFIIFSKYFKIQFAWPTFQKRSWSVMTIMSTNRKNTNVWGIPSMETYCNKVDHLFWFTILVQHETNDVILYIHSVHKHRGNSFQCQNYKMRLKQRSLNWINTSHSDSKNLLKNMQNMKTKSLIYGNRFNKNIITSCIVTHK
jgi:hypothetical protein